MPTDHALLAPSAAKRWITCTPSARVESLLPERTSPYAEEGTVAHSTAESLLHFYLDHDMIAVYDDPWAHLQEFHLYDPDLDKLAAECLQKGFDFREILETVHDKYVRFVWEDFVKARSADRDAVLLVEQRVDLSDFVPESFGSSDAVLIFANMLKVYDLKYGRGVRVSAKGNPQMRLYALGALWGPGETYSIDAVAMTIIQPRLNAVSGETLTVQELAQWTAEVLVPAARQAYTGTGDFVPGDHCEFCRAKATCRALAEFTQRVTTAYGDGALSADEIAAVLPKLPVIESWIAGIRGRAQEMLEHGETVPGWKLVEGRSTRRIRNEAEARRILSEAGFQSADYDKTELRGITDLTRLVGGAKVFNTLLGELVEKQPGKPALAPADDPRKDYSPAVSAEASFAEML